MVERRRIIDQLPAVHQTDTLRKFLGATADQLFQPAEVERLAGFIGQKPKQFNIEKDFYIAEPTPERGFYSLEPIAITEDLASGTINNVLFYEDIVNQLRFQGGVTTNQNRLFEQEYYSWSPPVDLDKLLNFTNYFWLEQGPDAIEILEATDATNDILGELQFTTTGGLEFTSGLRVIFRNDANPSFNDKIFAVEAVGRGILLLLEDDIFCPWDTLPWDECAWDVTIADGDPDYIVMERGAADGNPWSIANRWYHRNVIGDTNFTEVLNRQAKRPIIEFVRDLELFNYGLFRRSDADLLDNVHTDIFNEVNGLIDEAWDVFDWDAFDWDHGAIDLEIDDVQVRDGLRVLFISDTDSGANNRVYEITGIEDFHILNLVLVTDGEDPGGAPVEGEIIKIKFGDIFSNREFVFDGAAWIDAQSKLAENQSPLFVLYDTDAVRLDDPGTYPESNFFGGKVFSFQINDDTSEPIDPILGFRIVLNDFNEIVFQNNLVTDRFTFESGNEPITGFYFHRRKEENFQSNFFSNGWFPISFLTKQYIQDEFFVQADLENEFTISQEPDPPPKPVGELPNLTVELKNELLEEGPDYLLLETKTGNGDFRLIRIDENQIMTKGDRIVVRSFSKEGPLEENLVGFYEVPVNLQGNPDNEEVETISSSEFAEHFIEIIENQDGIEGPAFGTNNWRDTAQRRNFGRSILQHTAPMLRTMMLTADQNIDFMRSARFLEREYTRFRNKFFRKITEFTKLAEFDLEQNPAATPAFWVDNALEALNLGKTDAFPFAHSGMAGDGTFIPSTPSRLGVHSVFEPEKFLDDTLVVPTEVIRGHDGSYYIAAGDARDDAILELENRIFDSIPASYKGEERPDFDFLKFVSGKFRIADYTPLEFNRNLLPVIERWCSHNNVNFSKNTTFVPGDRFTWNFTGATDITGEQVNGSWLAIYNNFYDSTRPHTHPWEMLGFSIKPNWWEGRYGAAPYTSGNILLWTDLENGFIFDGPRQGTDLNFARPGLLNFIPVDNLGNLLDPVASGVIPEEPHFSITGADWIFGDEGPIETVWRRSEQFSFAVAQASYLMKPAQFIEFGWDPDRYDFVYKDQEDGSQRIFLETRDRPRHREFIVHGETSTDGSIFIGSGIQQWISDYTKDQGRDVTIAFGLPIRGLGVRLGHKAAGFVDINNSRFLADNFGLVPQEDTNLFLYRSPSIREEFYGGVIIEWNGKGWKVIGYDQLDPFFNFIPSDRNGRKIKITVDEESVIQYKDAVSSKRVERISYNHVFYNRQDVYDFLISYQRFLESKGWLFDEFDFDNNDFFDFDQAGRQFLFWSQAQWEPGNFIAVSPAARKVKFTTEQGAINSVEQIINGVYSILNREGRLISPGNTTVTRLDGSLDIIPNNIALGIFSTRLFISEIEHIFVFNNSTIFNDIIYVPLLNLRQSRLKLFGLRTGDWKGRLDAPGFIVQNNTIFANYEKTVDDFTKYFDIENPVEDITLRKFSRHLIDFQGRDYFDKLLFNNTTQFQFWQGMIRQKGTADVLDKLFRSEFVTESRDIQFFEEWAFRVGEFGAVEAQQILELVLKQKEIKADPQLIEFKNFVPQLPDNPSDDIINIPPDDDRWVLQPNDTENVFPIRSIGEPKSGDLPNAGFVRLGEPSAFATDNEEFFNIFEAQEDAGTPLSVGDLVWVLNTGLGDWDIFRLSDSGLTIARIEIGLTVGSPGIVVTTTPIGTIFDDDDTVVITGVSDSIPEIRGTFKASTINSVDTGELTIISNANIGIAKVVADTFFTVDKITVNVTRAFNGANPTMTIGDVIHPDRVATIPTSSLQTVGVDEPEPNFTYTFDTELQVFIDFDDSTEGSVEVTVEYSMANGFELFDFEDAPVQISETVFDGNIDIWKSMRFSNINKRNLFPASELSIGDLAYVDNKSYVLESQAVIDTPGTIPQIELQTFDKDTGLSTIISGPILIDDTSLDNNGIITVGDVAAAINLAGVTNVVASVIDNTKLILIHLKGEAVFAVDLVGNIAATFGLNKINKETRWAVYKWNGFVWGLFREEEEKIDASKIKNAIIYNKRLNRIDQFMTHWDPYKGVIPGIADKELAFKLEFDPAKYTNGNEEIDEVDPEQAWGEEQEGKLWWDLSTARYLNYEIDENRYRWQKWGQLAPGATVDVFEWVRSTVPPTSWASTVSANESLSDEGFSNKPSGEVRGEPATAPFVEQETFNRTTGIFATTFYFWVQNKITLPPQDFRSITSRTVAEIIINPTAAGIPWFAPISKNAVIVSGAKPFLTDDDSVLQVNWLTIDDETNLHRQWILHRPKDERSIPDDLLWDKMQDSLVGQDELGQAVPDIRLPAATKIGNFFKPRQSWFVNFLAARQTFIECTNNILVTVCLIEDRPDSLDRLEFVQPEPDASEFDFQVADLASRNSLVTSVPLTGGERVLVDPTVETFNKWTLWEFDLAETTGWKLIQIQTLVLADFWDFIDWFADGFNIDTVPDRTFTDLAARDLSAPFLEGEIIRVEDNGDGKFALYLFEDDNFTLVGKEDCTIEFNNLLYDVDAQEGWDTVAWDKTLWDPFPVEEMSEIITALREDIFEPIEINEAFFCMINFVHVEQNVVDWAFKTSLITISGFNEALEQRPIFQPDDVRIEPILDYIAEVKPYHVKVRTFIRRLFNQIENYPGHVTDFDKPPYFDEGLGEFRILDPNNVDDQEILANNLPWSDWWNNFQANPELIRQIKTTILIDRFACDQGFGWDQFAWDEIAWDSEGEIAGAAGRIAAYYEPQPGMPEKDIDSLLTGCEFGGTIHKSLDFEPNTTGWELDPWETEEYEELPEGGGSPEVFDTLIEGGDPDDEIETLTTGNGVEVVFPLPIIVTDPANVSVEVDGSLQIQGIFDDYVVGPNNNEIIFSSSSTPALGLDILITIEQTFIKAPTGPGDILIDGNKFVQPHWDAGHPEELVPIRNFDSTVFSVFTQGVAGAPTIFSNRVFVDPNVPAGPYNILQIPASVESVQVHVDGTFQQFFVNNDPLNDYELDLSAGTITFTSGNEPLTGQVVKITSFTTGGGIIGPSIGGRIIQTLFVPGDGSTDTFQVIEAVVDNQIFVTIDGEAVAFTTNDDEIIITAGAPLVGESVVITVFESGTTSFTVVRTDPFVVGSSPELVGNTLTLPTELQPGPTEPRHAAVIVHYDPIATANPDGVRLRPPPTGYLIGNGIQQEVTLNKTPTSASNLEVTIDGVMQVLDTDFFAIEVVTGTVNAPTFVVGAAFGTAEIEIKIGAAPFATFLLTDLDGDSQIGLFDFINSINGDTALDTAGIKAQAGDGQIIVVRSLFGDPLVLQDGADATASTCFGSSPINSVLSNTIRFAVPPANGANVVIVLLEDFEYKITGNGTTVEFDPGEITLVNNDTIWITTFTDNTSLEARTEVFDGTANGRYPLSQGPFNEQGFWVTRDSDVAPGGEKQVFLRDYKIFFSEPSWDEFAWDAGPPNAEESVITRGDFADPMANPGDQIDFFINGNIIPITITVVEIGIVNGFTDLEDLQAVIDSNLALQVAGITTELRIFLGFKKLVVKITAGNSFVMANNGTNTAMELFFGAATATSIPSGWDQGLRRAEIEFAEGHPDTDRIVITTFAGDPGAPGITFRLLTNIFGEEETIRISDAHKTFLRKDFAVGDTEIEVVVDATIIPALLPTPIFLAPNREERKPGAIYIDGERIEFWEVEGPTPDGGNPDFYTLKDIRRGTGVTNTGVPATYSTIIYTANGTDTTFALPSTATFRDLFVHFLDGTDETLQTTGFSVFSPNIIFDDPPAAGTEIRITLLHTDWRDTNVLYPTGTEVIAADLGQKVTGGYIFEPTPQGLQKSNSALAQFLLERPGTLD